MSEVQELVESARAAFRRADWAAALRGFEQARIRNELDAADFDLLARCHWWMGDVSRSMALAEDNFHRLVSGGGHRLAAMAALTLALQWSVRGELIVAFAWLNRARRLLDGLDEGPEHGYLLYLDGYVALEIDNSPDSTRLAVKQLSSMARRYDAPELESFAMALSGLVSVRAGETVRGFRDLDEAMLPVLAGRVPAEWGGDIYCSVIHLCHELADFGRMRAWTDSLNRWCSDLSDLFMYSDVTRVHQLQLISAEGGWDTVESEMLRHTERLRDGHNWLAGEGYYELGEIRRRRGNTAGAAEAFANARKLGKEPQPGAALLIAGTGAYDEALLILRAAIMETSELGRCKLLLPATEVASAAGARDEAEEFCRELERIAGFYGTPGLSGWAYHARAVVLLMEGSWAGALAPLQAAASIYRAQKLRYDLGRVHEQLARVMLALGRTTAARAERATAAAIFTQLGAGPTSLVTWMGPAPGGLTAREIEVLGWVLGGAGNRQVASALVISEKTVGRHLANIFSKIGVSSRTAAAAWARQHGISQRPRP